MYDLTERFRPIHTNTPPKVGPATYTLPDCIEGKNTQQYAPFLSWNERSFSLISPDAGLLPSAAHYYPRFRKNRVTGGSSLRNRAPRAPKPDCLKKPGPATYKVYQKPERKQGIGKLYVCRPPRTRKTLPTIPEKGLICYDYKQNGEPVKIFEPEGDTTLGPCFYTVPQGETCFNTKKYKVNHWSLMGEVRFKSKAEDTPGPGTYDLSKKPLPPHAVVQEKITERLRNASKGERYLDKVVNKTKREDLPGPGYYDITSKTEKKHKTGTLSTAPRGDIYQIIEGPGPAAYTDPRSSIAKAFKYTSYKGSPFMIDAPRSTFNVKPSPGPSDYDPSKGLFYDLQKKYYPEVSEKTPFSTTAIRNTGFVSPDSYFKPSPAEYNLQKKLVKRSKKHNMFSSKAPRFTEKVDMGHANCASYAIENAFNTIKNPRSHLKSDSAAFLTTSKQSDMFGSSFTPAPNTYNPPDSSLKIRGCVFPRDFHKDIIPITPGPLDYEIHPKTYKSSAFSTHNVTLKADQRMPATLWNKMLMAKKKLKCFAQ